MAYNEVTLWQIVADQLLMDGANNSQRSWYCLRSVSSASRSSSSSSRRAPLNPRPIADHDLCLHVSKHTVRFCLAVIINRQPSAADYVLGLGLCVCLVKFSTRCISTTYLWLIAKFIVDTLRTILEMINFRR